MQRASCVLERLPRPSAGTAMVRPARGPATVKCCFMSASRSLSLSSKCPYRILGVGSDADEETIRVAYRRKAKQIHPDCSGDPVTAIAFMECQSAYQTLLDPEKRAKYDKTLLPRANHQVLSYLNARSAARHGVVTARVPSRNPYHKPELYSTMLELLAQVKSCAKHLEHEIIGKPGPSGPCTPTARSTVPVPVALETECGEHECCEPWIYYASQPVAEEVPAGAKRRR